MRHSPGSPAIGGYSLTCTVHSLSNTCTSTCMQSSILDVCTSSLLWSTCTFNPLLPTCVVAWWLYAYFVCSTVNSSIVGTSTLVVWFSRSCTVIAWVSSISMGSSSGSPVLRFFLPLHCVQRARKVSFRSSPPCFRHYIQVGLYLDQSSPLSHCVKLKLRRPLCALQALDE